MSETITSAVFFAIIIIALYLMILFTYKTVTGSSPNKSCEYFAGQFKISFFVPWIQFAPFTPICDVLIPV